MAQERIKKKQNKRNMVFVIRLSVVVHHFYGNLSPVKVVHSIRDDKEVRRIDLFVVLFISCRLVLACQLQTMRDYHHHCSHSHYYAL